MGKNLIICDIQVACPYRNQQRWHSAQCRLMHGDQARLFEDEIREHLKHKQKGTVAMASASRSTCTTLACLLSQIDLLLEQTAYVMTKHMQPCISVQQQHQHLVPRVHRVIVLQNLYNMLCDARATPSAVSYTCTANDVKFSQLRPGQYAFYYAALKSSQASW